MELRKKNREKELSRQYSFKKEIPIGISEGGYSLDFPKTLSKI